MKRRIKNKIAKRKGLIQSVSKIEKSKYQRDRKKLINEYNKNIRKVNIQLTRIRREFGNLQYSSKKLVEDITARKNLRKAYNLKTGRIQIRKSLSNTDLRDLNSLLNKFLKTKTRTVAGIKARRESARLGLKQLIGDIDTDIDDESIEKFARTFQNADFRWLTRYGIDESEFVNMVFESLRDKWTEEYFVETLVDYMQIIPDEDMKDDLVGLYNKYVRGNYFGL